MGGHASTVGVRYVGKAKLVIGPSERIVSLALPGAYVEPPIAGVALVVVLFGQFSWISRLVRGEGEGKGKGTAKG